MLARVDGLGEEPGRLDDDVDAELGPGEVCGVALREDQDGLAIDDDLVAVELDGRVEASCDGVVLEEMRQRLVVGEVVHRNDLKLASLRERGAEEVAADAAEAVDTDLDSQWISKC